MPERPSKDIKECSLESYLASLEQIKVEFIRCRQIQDDYSQIEDLLQKEEATIRKKMATEQQMKLYCDSLKLQIT